MKTDKKYDFSKLNDFFNRSMSPEEVLKELVRLMFNYAISFDESNVENFKNDACTIYMLYNNVSSIKEIHD